LSQRSIEIRFYEELNDFLPPGSRKKSWAHEFSGTPSVKDVIESLGVPHVEVDLILVDGESVGFDHRLEGGERVAVYPVFERLDISGVTRLRPKPLREPRFIADVHLGTLARYLRLLGFDTAYGNDLEDSEIAGRAQREHRIVLTRDRGLLMRSAVTHGHWIREKKPRKQLVEVVEAFDLRSRIAPFTRCMKCNGTLSRVSKDAVRDELPPRTRQSYDDFLQCRACRQLYWPGTHFRRLEAIVTSVDPSFRS